jgi:hypothetical protein
MGAPTLRVRKDPYVGYDPKAVALASAACLDCGEAPPCMQACERHVDIHSIIQVAGKAACEALALTRWFADKQDVEAARITDMICDSYNG